MALGSQDRAIATVEAPGACRAEDRADELNGWRPKLLEFLFATL